MPSLHIEHPVPNFDGWKKAFDSEPVNRAKSNLWRNVEGKVMTNPQARIMNEVESREY